MTCADGLTVCFTGNLRFRATPDDDLGHLPSPEPVGPEHLLMTNSAAVRVGPPSDRDANSARDLRLGPDPALTLTTPLPRDLWHLAYAPHSSSAPANL